MFVDPGPGEKEDDEDDEVEEEDVRSQAPSSRGERMVKNVASVRSGADVAANIKHFDCIALPSSKGARQATDRACKRPEQEARRCHRLNQALTVCSG